MKISFLFSFLMGLHFIAQAQILSLKDQSTGEGLEKVTLVSHSPKIFALSNHLGQVDISAFRGVAQIEIRMLGYKTQIRSYAQIENANFELFLEVAPAQFDEVVVSATRWTQNAKNIPSKISVISQQDVALQNPQTVADLLGTSGEVFIQKSQQGGGSPMIRGFATNRLLYSVDGVRMNSAIFRSGNIQNVISLDAFAIENTEIFFGAASVIYGSDAIGGVMSFRTLTPQFSLDEKNLINGKLVGRYSSANNEITQHFDLKWASKKWASVTSFTYSQFGDLKMGKNGKDEYLKTHYVQRIDNTDKVIENPNPLIQNPSGYSQMNLMQKIAFRPHKNWDFEYALHYSETSEYSRYDRLLEKQSNGLPVSALWNYGPQIWAMNLLSVVHRGSHLFYDQMNLRLAHQYFEESRIDRRLNHHRLRTNLEKVQAYSLNLDFEKNLDRHIFHYGLEYVLNDVRSLAWAVDIRNASPIAVPDRYPQSKWKSYAAYLSYQFLWNEKLVLQAGTRYNAFGIDSDFSRHLQFFPFDFSQSRFQNAALTGNLALIFSPNDTWKISGNLGTAFRSPNVDDIGKIFDFVSGEVVVPNTALRAEYAYNAELGVSKIIKNILKLELTAFYTHLDNAMVRRAFSVNGEDSINYAGKMSKVYAIQNAAYGQVYGFNAGLEFKLPSGFGFAWRYSYQLGREEMDNSEVSPSRHAAPAFGVSRIFYQKNQLNLQIYAMYNGEVQHKNLNIEERSKTAIYAKDQEGKPYSPSWYTLNFKAMYQFHQNFSVSAGIENITDQRYRPYSSGLVAAGRNMIFSLRANF